MTSRAKGVKRDRLLRNFAKNLLTISEKVGFKLSSRGWCYQLEGFNYITKGDFDEPNAS